MSGASGLLVIGAALLVVALVLVYALLPFVASLGQISAVAP